jgi:hypothetical protein
VECEDVPKKPDISYKLSTWTTKESALHLASDEDWTGCIDDFKAAASGRKGGVMNFFDVLYIARYHVILRTWSVRSSI